jgi:hypothetical protein
VQPAEIEGPVLPPLLGEGVEAVQIGYNAKSRAVGIRPAPEGGRGVLKLRAQPNGRSKLVDAKMLL